MDLSDGEVVGSRGFEEEGEKEVKDLGDEEGRGTRRRFAVSFISFSSVAIDTS